MNMLRLGAIFAVLSISFQTMVAEEEANRTVYLVSGQPEWMESPPCTILELNLDNDSTREIYKLSYKEDVDTCEYINVNPIEKLVSFWNSKIIATTSDFKPFSLDWWVTIDIKSGTELQRNYSPFMLIGNGYFVDDMNSEVKTMFINKEKNNVIMGRTDTPVANIIDFNDINWNSIRNYGQTDFFQGQNSIPFRLDKSTGNCYFGDIKNKCKIPIGITLPNDFLNYHRDKTSNGEWIIGPDGNSQWADGTIRILTDIHLLVDMLIHNPNGHEYFTFYHIIYNKENHTWKRASIHMNLLFKTILESGEWWVAPEYKKIDGARSNGMEDGPCKYHFYNFDGEEKIVWETTLRTEFLLALDHDILYRREDEIYICPIRDDKIVESESRLCLKDDRVWFIHWAMKK